MPNDDDISDDRAEQMAKIVLVEANNRGISVEAVIASILKSQALPIHEALRAGTRGTLTAHETAMLMLMREAAWSNVDIVAGKAKSKGLNEPGSCLAKFVRLVIAEADEKKKPKKKKVFTAKAQSTRREEVERRSSRREEKMDSCLRRNDKARSVMPDSIRHPEFSNASAQNQESEPQGERSEPSGSEVQWTEQHSEDTKPTFPQISQMQDDELDSSSRISWLRVKRLPLQSLSIRSVDSVVKSFSPQKAPRPQREIEEPQDGYRPESGMTPRKGRCQCHEAMRTRSGMPFDTPTRGRTSNIVRTLFESRRCRTRRLLTPHPEPP